MKMSLIVWPGPVISILQRLGWREVTDVYAEERRRKYGSLGKTVLQESLSADLIESTVIVLSALVAVYCYFYGVEVRHVPLRIGTTIVISMSSLSL